MTLNGHLNQKGSALPTSTLVANTHPRKSSTQLCYEFLKVVSLDMQPAHPVTQGSKVF